MSPELATALYPDSGPNRSVESCFHSSVGKSREGVHVVTMGIEGRFFQRVCKEGKFLDSPL
jgi:hypothetical protein